MLVFDNPTKITQCKLGDTMIVSAVDETGYDLVMRIYDIDENLLYGPVINNTERLTGELYWFFTVDSTYGISNAKSYYIIEIGDFSTSDYDPTWHILYVNDDVTMENYIIRSQGLAGHNCRKFNYVWVRGMLTQFDIRTYTDTEALETADEGNTDEYIAHYRVTIQYDNSYQPYEISSIRLE